MKQTAKKATGIPNNALNSTPLLFSNAELIALGVFTLLSLCSFMFVYDLWHTSASSFAFLNGHFFF